MNSPYSRHIQSLALAANILCFTKALDLFAREHEAGRVLLVIVADASADIGVIKPCR